MTTLDDVAAAHHAITTGTHTLYAERARVIRAAKADGATWPEIAAVLGMRSAHGAIKASRYGADEPVPE
ncbi:MAG: hypothetical protein IJO71_02720 [Microbacterium sp.]|uniref:hypothetical protein n=1 Tax=Microbacterium sp. TaxID=51671 RepID=UPI0026008BF2|nr:hypothetical protein [Microbacterium sp.]MBQ9916096.1 hypothetical protein [Microbacterium sp.]